MSPRRQAVLLYGGARMVDLDLIVIWSGSLETIPAGWYLCDGANATPDLRDRFVLDDHYERALDAESRQYGAATGVLYGHDHNGGNTDEESAHQHPVLGDFTSPQTVNTGLGSGGGASHTHSGATPPGSAHSHRMRASSYHEDAVEVSTIPPYYSLAYIMGSGEIPVGGLALVYLESPETATLPAGYFVCDGYNGTPDLYWQYVVGAGRDFLLNQTGGNYYLTVSDHQHPNGSVSITPEDAHTHTYLSGDRFTEYTALTSESYGLGGGGLGSALAVSHNHQMDVGAVSGTVSHKHGTVGNLFDDRAGGDGDESFPPSFVLTWIMRVS